MSAGLLGDPSLVVTSRITKLDAAHRQLESAILMFFTGGDAVSVHILAYSSFRLLQELADHKGSETHSMIKSTIHPDHLKKFWWHIGKWADFCKHARTDPDEILLDFREDSTPFQLMFAAKYLADMGHELSPDVMAFLFWMQLKYPHIVKKEISEVPEMEGLRSIFHSQTYDKQLEAGQLLIEEYRKQEALRSGRPPWIDTSRRPKIVMREIYPARRPD